MTTARGTEPESTVGPLIDAKSRDKVHELVTDAVSPGAKAVVGGGAGVLLPAHDPEGCQPGNPDPVRRNLWTPSR